MASHLLIEEHAQVHIPLTWSPACWNIHTTDGAKRCPAMCMTWAQLSVLPALVVLMKHLFPFQSPQVIPFCLETAMRPWAFLEMNLIKVQGHKSCSAISSAARALLVTSVPWFGSTVGSRAGGQARAGTGVSQHLALTPSSRDWQILLLLTCLGRR